MFVLHEITTGSTVGHLAPVLASQFKTAQTGYAVWLKGMYSPISPIKSVKLAYPGVRRVAERKPTIGVRRTQVWIDRGSRVDFDWKARFSPVSRYTHGAHMIGEPPALVMGNADWPQ